MIDITSLLRDLKDLFVLVIGLALLVVGFWKGRKWMDDAMGDSEMSPSDRAADRASEDHVTFENRARGSGLGWKGGKGSGLHRGRR